MAIALVGFTLFVNRGNLKIIRPATAKWYMIAITVGLLYVFIQTPLNLLYNFISGENFSIIYDFDGWESFTDINVLSTILLIPITEELFFREFLQRNMQTQTTGFVAIGITSLLFAAIHLPYFEWFFGYSNASIHHAYIALFGGFVLGYVYLKSNSVGPSILMHMLWNTMVVII